MTIAVVRPVPVGNALQLKLQPPSRATSWRLLRNTTGAFTGPDDTSADVIHDDTNDDFLLDDQGVINGVQYYYTVYYRDAVGWFDSGAATGTAAATYEDRSVDPLEIVRSRLEAGLKVEVQRGLFKPQNGVGVPVLLAPPAIQNTVWPVITVHLDGDSSQERSAGEMKFPDVKGDTGVFIEGEGWLAQVSLAIVGWSLNADERSALRRSIKRIVIGNLPVFDGHGMVTVDFSQQDIEDFTSYDSPVYQTVGRFSCKAPAFVIDPVDPILDVSVEASDVYF